MFTPATNMDCERYQDLSELGLFGQGAQTWAVDEVSEETPNKLSEMQGGMHPSKTHFNSLDYENTDYILGDMSNQFYNISRTDSMEEMKNLPLTAPMEVVPMRHHETLQVSGIVKTEKEDLDVGREEEVEVEFAVSPPIRPTQLKIDPVFKEDPDLLLLDTPDLLLELQEQDLISYILDTPTRSPSGPLATPPHIHLGTPPRSLATPPRSLATPPRSLATPPRSLASPPHSLAGPPSRSLATPSRLLATPPRSHAAPSRSMATPPRFSSADEIKSNSFKAKPVRETYLAIPREITAGIGDDKKIPKMLILKTQESTTLSSQLHDMAMSIAERIKTVGKRQRTKRYSDASEDDEDASEDESQKQSPRKRARRTSTCSTNTSSGQDRYRELRDKNNEASRKSRQNRKEKERDLMSTLDDAEQENTQLRARSDELEKLVHSLRKLLLQIVVSKGTQR